MRAVAEAMPAPTGRAAVLVSAWTGMRIGELVELRWRAVAWADERLHVRRAWSRSGVKGTKGGHGRPVPMIADLVALLGGLSRRGHSTGACTSPIRRCGGTTCGTRLRRSPSRSSG